MGRLGGEKMLNLECWMTNDRLGDEELLNFELFGLGREGIAGSIVFTPLPGRGRGWGSPQKRGNTRLDVAPLSCDIKPLLS